MTTHNTCYQNGMQQPAIILILCRSNHRHHTLSTSMSTHPDWRELDIKNIIKTSISDATVRNYSALLADEGNISISHSYTSKSNTWYAAKNSICGSIATLGVIATTHFIAIDKEDEDICAKLKSLPEATCKLYDIVTDIFGTPVYPV